MTTQNRGLDNLLILSLEKKYGEEVQKLYNYLTPGTPGLHQVREKDTALMLPKETQERYRSGIGMVLYLVKYSQPDIANSVRELSKVLHCSTNGAYKEMLLCIKYFLGSKSLGLKIWPVGNKSKP